MSEEPSSPTPRGDLPADDEERPGLSAAIKIGIVFVLLAGAVGFLLIGSGAGEAFVYSKLVHEVVDNPSQFAGREIRVEGDLRQGSVQFREDPCEWRFVLTKEGREMPVRFPQCVVPDTFRDDYGISVTVQGQIDSNGTFHADQVVPRCPSKYEQKLKNGEHMPNHHPAALPDQQT